MLLGMSLCVSKDYIDIDRVWYRRYTEYFGKKKKMFGSWGEECLTEYSVGFIETCDAIYDEHVFCL